jgi:hypothetical protein
MKDHTRLSGEKSDKEFQMIRKALTVSAIATCVMGASPTTTQAAVAGFQESLLETLIGGPGPRPPPKFDDSDPVTNPPGPKPPPKLDGSDPVTNPPGPKPPPR